MAVYHLNNEFLQRINRYQPCETVVLTINDVSITFNKAFAITFSQNFYSKYLLNNLNNTVNINVEMESQETYDVLEHILHYDVPEIECNQTVLKDLFHIGTLLGMSELMNLYINQNLAQEPIDSDNCIQMLDYYLTIQSPEKIHECIDVISSFFFKICLLYTSPSPRD